MLLRLTSGRVSRLGLAACLVLLAAPALRGQDLAPRAYLITPVRSNAVTMAYSYNDGNLLFDGTDPHRGRHREAQRPVDLLHPRASASSAARPT